MLNRFKLKDSTGKYSIVVPIVFFILFMIFPSIWLSLNARLEFEYFVRDDFLLSLKNSIIYSFTTVFFQFGLGLIAAICIYYSDDMKKYFRMLIMILLFMPYAIPSISAVISWKFCLDRNGFLSILLFELFNIDPIQWYQDNLLESVIIVSVWQFYPFAFISFLVGLRRIPKKLLYTARIDGANKIQEIFYVLLPQLNKSKLILVVLILRFLFMFTKFDTPYLMGVSKNSVPLSLLPTEINKYFSGNSVDLAISYALIIAILIIFFCVAFYIIYLLYSSIVWVYRKIKLS